MHERQSHSILHPYLQSHNNLYGCKTSLMVEMWTFTTLYKFTPIPTGNSLLDETISWPTTVFWLHNRSNNNHFFWQALALRNEHGIICFFANVSRPKSNTPTVSPLRGEQTHFSGYPFSLVMVFH